MSDTLDESLYAEALNTFKGCGNISISLVQMCFGVKFITASAIIQRMHEESLLPCKDMSEEEQRQAEEKQRALMRTYQAVMTICLKYTPLI